MIVIDCTHNLKSKVLTCHETLRLFEPVAVTWTWRGGPSGTEIKIASIYWVDWISWKVHVKLKNVLLSQKKHKKKKFSRKNKSLDTDENLIEYIFYSSISRHFVDHFVNNFFLSKIIIHLKWYYMDS